jgi:DNA-binding transcriptional ArsR family regulator
MDAEPLDREVAETYAGWFRALADPTRVQILHLLAVAGRPLPVGEIVERVHIGQSTVSHHLAVLAAVRFVLAEPAGTARLYRVNDACVRCFPSAADVVMGRAPAVPEEVADDGRTRRPAR